MVAFVTTGFAATAAKGDSSLVRGRFSSRSAVAARSQRAVWRMKAEAEAESSEDAVSKEEILSQLKADVAADPLKGRGQFDGKTWDGDGRQNNWAIEPQESIEGSEATDKKQYIIFLVGAIALAFAAALPYINFSNPDQL